MFWSKRRKSIHHSRMPGDQHGCLWSGSVFFIASHVISFAYIPIQESCVKSCHHLQLNTLLKVVKVSATLNFRSLFAILLQSGFFFFFDLAWTESHWFHQNILCRIKITLCLYKAKEYNIFLHKSLKVHDRNYSHLQRLQKKITRYGYKRMESNVQWFGEMWRWHLREKS